MKKALMIGGAVVGAALLARRVRARRCGGLRRREDDRADAGHGSAQVDVPQHQRDPREHRPDPGAARGRARVGSRRPNPDCGLAEEANREATVLDAAQLTEAVPSPPVDGGHPDREPGRLIDRLDPIDDFNFRHFRIRHMVAELLRPGLLPGSRGARLRAAVHRRDADAAERPARAAGAASLRQLHLPGHARRRIHDAGASPALRRASAVRRGPRPSSPPRRATRSLPLVRAEAGRRPRLQTRGTASVAGAHRRPGRHGPARLRRAGRRRLPDRQPGDVAFCGTWGQSPALRHAIDDLLARGGAGAPAGKGIDRRPHLAARSSPDRAALSAAGRQALIDLELGFPGAMILMTIGRVARPVLAPLALRTTPLPNRARAALFLGLVGASTAVGLESAAPPASEMVGQVERVACSRNPDGSATSSSVRHPRSCTTHP